MQAKDLLVTGDVRVVGDIYSPSLDFTPTLTSGTQVGTIKMNGKTTNIYAPAGGGSATGAAANYTLAKSGNKIQLKKDGTTVSEVTDDNNTYTIPSVGNGTLTIQRNGTTVATFSANQSGNTTANITDNDTNTHYTTRIYAGASGTAANASATNPYIKITDDNTYRNQIQIKGGGATSVSSDANGVITITSTDNNTQRAYYTSNPAAPGTASPGSSAAVARGDHVHPLQTSVTGSSGSCTGNAAGLTGGAYVVASSSQPTNANAMIWIKTTS